DSYPPATEERQRDPSNILLIRPGGQVRQQSFATPMLRPAAEPTLSANDAGYGSLYPTLRTELEPAHAPPRVSTPRLYRTPILEPISLLEPEAEPTSGWWFGFLA